MAGRQPQEPRPFKRCFRLPIVFFNGHEAPNFEPEAKLKLREFVDQGGFIFADACCGSRGFDQGFRRLMKELFPEEAFQLKLLPPDHPVWRSGHLIAPECSTLCGEW